MFDTICSLKDKKFQLIRYYVNSMIGEIKLCTRKPLYKVFNMTKEEYEVFRREIISPTVSYEDYSRLIEVHNEVLKKYLINKLVDYKKTPWNV